MGTGLFLFLVIVAIIILAVIVFCIIKVTSDSLNDTTVVIEIGDICSDTLNCPLGLECDSGRCRIPLNGPCLLFPNLCVTGSTCVNGRCISLLQEENEINFPIIDSQYSNTKNSKFESIYIDNKLIFQGNINDASTSSEKLIENGIWIVHENKISYIDDRGKLHFYIIEDTILSCEAFDDICFILTENSELYLASFKDKIIVEKLEFPSSYEGEIINDGLPINLGKNIQNKLIIVMTNGIWIIDTFNKWTWITTNNSNITYLTFISKKKLSIYNDMTYSYNSITGNWNEQSYPKIESTKVINSEYWFKSILGLK